MADAYDFWAERLPSEDFVLIDDFWLRFAEIAPRIERYFRGLARGIDPDAEVRAALGPLADRLVCDFEFGAEGKLALVITPELYHSRRPLARAAVARAPQLPGWEVRDARWAVARVPDAVRAILGRSRSEALAVERLIPRRGAHRLVDLVAQGFGDREFLADQGGVIFSVLLGERADQDWLGTTYARRWPIVSLTSLSFRRERPRNDRWLTEFRERATDLIVAFEAERPARRFSDRPMRVEDTVSFRLRPGQGDRERRRDALFYQSRHSALTAARLAGVRIGGARFSRFKEIFCGLKIRRTNASPFAEVADIATLGARIEDALMGPKLGGVIGRASGLEHVYIDLALLDLRGSLDALRRALGNEGVLAPVWLIFDDAGLEDLYHPLMPQTPPTPVQAV